MKSKSKVLTKFDMAYEMDMAGFKRLPWCVMYDAFSKAELVEFYNEFKSKNLKSLWN